MSLCIPENSALQELSMIIIFPQTMKYSVLFKLIKIENVILYYSHLLKDRARYKCSVANLNWKPLFLA